MRVLLVSGSLPPMKCGIGDYTALLAKALNEYTSIKIGVLTHYSAQSTSTTSDFETLAVARTWSWSDLKRLLIAIAEWEPTLIHFQFPTQGYGQKKLPWVLPFLLAICGYPIVQTWHEYVFQHHGLADWKNSLLYVANMFTPGGLIVVRPGYLEHLPKIYRQLITRKHFCFIPNSSAIPPISLSEDTRQTIRDEMALGHKFIAYFGFALPNKGIELLFEVLDPNQHYLVLICNLNNSEPYHSIILEKVNTTKWATRVKVTGFLSAERVGELLAAADAIVLPFRNGGGSWNTSLQAALQSGTFVLTTSNERQGYDRLDNVFYAKPDNVPEMRRAVSEYMGRRIEPKNSAGWERIAREHNALYSKVIKY